LEYAALSIIFFFYKHRKVDLQCSIEIRIIRCSNKKNKRKLYIKQRARRFSRKP